MAADISSARENRANVSPLVRSSMVTRSLLARDMGAPLEFFRLLRLVVSRPVVGWADDSDVIDAVGLDQADLNLLVPGAGYVLADVVCPYRHLAVAAVNKDRQ